MKILKTSVVVIFSVVMFSSISSCSDADNQKEIVTEISAENVLVADYEIEGMVCAMGCAKTIENELIGMNGIAACSVNFEEGKAHIEFDQTQLTEKEIISKIEGMAKGQYKVSPWKDKEGVEENTSDDSEGTLENEETVSEVSLTSIKIPNLFTLLMNQL
jgi:periplasmic mercuric ion binding protein